MLLNIFCHLTTFLLTFYFFFKTFVVMTISCCTDSEKKIWVTVETNAPERTILPGENGIKFMGINIRGMDRLKSLWICSLRLTFRADRHL